MSKSVITRLFVGAFIAVIVGTIVAIAAVLSAVAAGTITVGTDTVQVSGGPLTGTLVWLVVAGLAIAAGTVAALASWIGALLNTSQLDDKTWFVLLLVLGIFSFGWIAMIAYVLAGPDGTVRRSPAEAARPVATH